MENMKELNLDELEEVNGGAGSGNGMVESDGTVTAFSDAGTFKVNVGGQTVTASKSGQLRMNYIRIASGDRVRVQYSPDSLRGRITYRYK